MKRNAIIRIVLWSIVLAVLLAILFILIYVPGAGHPLRDETPAETMVPVPLTRVPDAESASANAVTVSSTNVRSTPETTGEVVAFAERGTKLQILRLEQIGGKKWGYIGSPTMGWIDMYYVELLEPVTESAAAATEVAEIPEDGQYNAVVTADAVNVRSAPSTEAPNAGMVKKGDRLLITRQEIVNDISWGYTPSPVNGWVVMEYVKLLEPVAEYDPDIETTVPQEAMAHANLVTTDAANIQEIEIEWAAGSITIQPKAINEIRIMEDGLSPDMEPMVWNVRDNKISIQYSRKMDHEFGIGLVFGKENSKDLIIQVPFDWVCNSLEIDAASASLEIHDLTIRKMEFDGASGTCVFNNCTVENLDLDTASGDILFQGQLTQMDCDAASANIILDLTNVPKNLNLDTASGDLNLVLPEGAGFTLSMDTLSGSFESDFDTVQRNGSYVAGNGRCRIDVDAMSGDVTIRKGA